MPIVTLSKSMSSAALGAWWGLDNAVGDIACGPRCTGAIACGPRRTGATCRCAAGDADRWGRELIFFGNYLCEAACLRIFAATAARRVNPATDAAGGASSGPCERVNPQLTGRRILEVAPYGYNLYPNPHESTAFSHATGPDPVAVRDRSGILAHVIVERNGQHRSPIRDRTTGLGQRGGERREGDRGSASGPANAVAEAGYRCARTGAPHVRRTSAPIQFSRRPHRPHHRHRGPSRASDPDGRGVSSGGTSEQAIESTSRRVGAVDGADWSW